MAYRADRRATYVPNNSVGFYSEDVRLASDLRPGVVAGDDRAREKRVMEAGAQGGAERGRASGCGVENCWKRTCSCARFA